MRDTILMADLESMNKQAKQIIDVGSEGIRLLRGEQRGQADYGWLQANYSFSFGQYHDPERMGFGHLRVLNQDHIQGGGGFGTHGHQDMEIITWVQGGDLRHRDSIGNEGSIRAGELQVMSAGSGIQHSEYNGSPDEGVDLLQMWILPETRGGTPSWEQRVSPTEERNGAFVQLVGHHRDAREGLLTIGQDAALYAALLHDEQRASIELEAGRRGYLHVAKGSLRWGDQTLEKGDALSIEAQEFERALHLHGVTGDHPADVIFWNLA